MAGLPPSAVIGVRNAVTRGSGQRTVPVLSTLGGSIVAVTAMVAAVVFSVSLTSLTSHPARFGWNWDVLVQAESGYGSFNPGVMSRLVGGQPSVAGWSELAFTQLSVDGRDVPVVGLQRHTGDVVPPTTSGQPLSGPGQVELGAQTLAELGKKVGDTVTVGSPPYARQVTITGTVTLPSIGVAETDHVSLGRGVLLPEATLLAAVGATGGPQSATISQPVFPSTAVIDLTPGTTGPQRTALVHRIVSANPDGTPGGTYELPPQLASEVYNAEQLGRQPVALAVGLAVASVLSLSMTVFSLVRRRRQEFALLKTLGMNDPASDTGGHRLADLGDAADRGRCRPGPGHRARPVRLAGFRRVHRRGPGERGARAGAGRRPGRPGADRKPARVLAGHDRGPDAGGPHPQDRSRAGLGPSASAACLAPLFLLSLTGRPLRYRGHGRVGLVQRPGRTGGGVALLGRQGQPMDQRPGQRQGDGQQDPHPQPPG
jgi:hypothetical protein